MTAFKNRSQLEDLTKTPEELDKQRLHTTTLGLYSCPPPIGHVYSVMMEEVGVSHNLSEFIGRLKAFMKEDLSISQPYPLSALDTLNPGTIQAFSHYLFERGIEEGAIYHDLMKEAMGYDCEWLRKDFREDSLRFFRGRRFDAKVDRL